MRLRWCCCQMLYRSNCTAALCNIWYLGYGDSRAYGCGCMLEQGKCGGDSARQRVTKAPSSSLLGLALVESLKTRTSLQLNRSVCLHCQSSVTHRRAGAGRIQLEMR